MTDVFPEVILRKDNVEVMSKITCSGCHPTTFFIFCEHDPNNAVSWTYWVPLPLAPLLQLCALFKELSMAYLPQNSSRTAFLGCSVTNSFPKFKCFLPTLPRFLGSLETGLASGCHPPVSCSSIIGSVKTLLSPEPLAVTRNCIQPCPIQTLPTWGARGIV